MHRFLDRPAPLLSDPSSSFLALKKPKASDQQEDIKAAFHFKVDKICSVQFLIRSFKKNYLINPML